MNSVQQLTFMTTATGVAVSVAIVLTVIAISAYSWSRSGYSLTHGLQELLRVVIVILIAVLFNQPEWVEEFRPETKPAIAILYDDSRSMETQDVAMHEATRSIMSRREAIAPLTETETWQKLARRFDVVVEPIVQNTEESGTNLYDPLHNVSDRVKNLLGVVLISDGDWNTGKPPVEAASRLRLQKIPVYTVAAGSENRLPDIELTAVDLPTIGVAGKSVRIPFTIESSLPREYLTTVTATTSSGETLTKDVRVAPAGKTSDAIVWNPLTEGNFTVTLEVPQHTDELILDNNARTAPISIREEKLRVLIVESVPRWEYRYLRNALSRDPGVEVSCLLFHPGLSKTGGGSSDYIKQFPASIEEIAPYDVVFLGDVGVEPDQLTTEQCELIKGLIEKQASGLILMPGWQGRHSTLIDSPLGELYPVQLDPLQEGGWGSRTASILELTETGRRSLLTRLADTAEENLQIWETLPGFQWYAAVVRAKAGTETLAVHGDMSNEYGRLPLLVTRTYGAGKVLFMGTDGAWRWRKGVEDQFHYRFWGQVIRWMAYQRNMAKGENMRLFYTPEQPEVRNTLSLTAHVMSDSGEPLSKGDVIARIKAPSGKLETVRLQSEGAEWGVFRGQFTTSEAGAHQVTLASGQTSTTLQTEVYVQGQALELIGKPARPDVLEEIARMTDAAMVGPNEVERIVQSLSTLPQPPLSVRRLQLWSHPAIAGVVVVLLGIFWVWRKATGLV